MIFNRSDIFFAKDDTHKFLPSLIGVMACLATLLFCLGLTLNSWIVSRHENYATSFTVNIPANTDSIDVKTAKIRDVLKRTAGVVDVTQLDQDQLKTMLKPWLGSNDSLEGLPLPAVLNVTLENSQMATKMDYNGLEKNLQAIASGTEVDAHERWVAAFSQFSAAAQGLILTLGALILATMGTMIIFTSRESLRLHSRTVHLLHAMGAEDAYIARQFQWEAFLLVLPGAFAGCMTAGLIYWAMSAYFSSLSVSLMPTLALSRAHIILLIATPPACAIAAWAVTRWSVLRQLQNNL